MITVLPSRTSPLGGLHSWTSPQFKVLETYTPERYAALKMKLRLLRWGTVTTR